MSAFIDPARLRAAGADFHNKQKQGGENATGIQNTAGLYRRCFGRLLSALRTGIPTNGMHDYIVGAGLALEKLAESLFEKSSADLSGSFSLNAPGGKPRINILGMTPLDFAAKGSCASLRQLLEEEGFAVQSVWAMDDSLESLRKAPAADANLVISAAGLRTAGYMKKRFGIPWVAGIPVGISGPVCAPKRMRKTDRILNSPQPS